MYDKCSDCEYGDIENLRVENRFLKEENEKLKMQNQKDKEVFDESYIRVTHLLDYYNHYKALPNSIIDELINLQLDLDRLKEVE